MDIPNLSPAPTPPPVNNSSNNKIYPVIIILALSLASGFWLSRLVPLNRGTGEQSDNTTNNTQETLSTDNISNASQLSVGKLYGNTQSTFKDSALGTIDKGSVNGEGTHLLKREGGDSQTVALTSSVVDLDLFIGKKVEIKGETNASKKAAWFMDVGSVKLLE